MSHTIGNSPNIVHVLWHSTLNFKSAKDSARLHGPHCTANDGKKGDPVWVDTMGWDDDNLKDESAFKIIISFLKDEDLKVKAILWMILPNIRQDTLLLKQARMIDKFKEVDIWKNVIIVCKKPINLEEDVQGARHAAKTISQDQDLDVQALGYAFLEGTSWTVRQRAQFEDDSFRSDFNVKNDEEVRDAIFDAISNLPKPTQVRTHNHSLIFHLPYDFYHLSHFL